MYLETMHHYFIELLTKKDLDAESFAPEFLHAWINGNSQLRPERYGSGEPVRYSIEERGGIPAILDAWRQTMLMFKRVNEPKYTMDTVWSRTRKLNPRPYLGEAAVWLSKKATDRLALEFFEFLVKWFEPEFGFITTWDDRQTKHHLTYPDFREDGTYLGTAESSVGADFLQGIPGIYWVTYMTSDVMDAEKIETLGDKIARRDMRGGHYIRAYENSSLIGTESGRAAEEAIINALGREKFFNADAWLKAQEAKAR